MKKALLFLILSPLFHNALAQDYIPYFNLCNKADKHHHFEKYDSALFYYQEASSLVPYMHAEYCKKASISAAQTDNFDLAFTYAAKALSRGEDEAFIYSDAFIPFRRVNQFKVLIESLVQYKQLRQQSINFDYQKAIDSLSYVNQHVIYKYEYYEGPKFNIPKWAYYKDTAVLKEYVFQSMLKLIDQYGFPSERLLGKSQVFHAFVILIHPLSKPENFALFMAYEKYLHSGEFLPSQFAPIYDSSFGNRGESCQLLYACGEPEKAHRYEIAKADSIRLIYGIKPVESTYKDWGGYKTKW